MKKAGFVKGEWRFIAADTRSPLYWGATGSEPGNVLMLLSGRVTLTPKPSRQPEAVPEKLQPG